MIKELEDAIALVDTMPEAYQRRVLAAVMQTVDEYEDWRASGMPDAQRYQLIKYVRDPRFAESPLRELVQRLLKDTE